MVVLASAWNQQLAYKFGQSFGDDMKSVGIMGLWGWAIDNHRSMFFSRNHESPSEDAILASYTIMNAVNGLHTRGRYCTLKHFAIYDCGANAPKNTSYWLTEQSLRENQLRGYYKPIVLAGALGVMTAYRGPGAAVAESSVGMITGILRREWQFKGAITTDYTGTETGAHSELIVRAGGDLGMGNKLTPNGWTYDSTTSLRFQNRLKEVTKEVLYMWLHADYLERDYKDKIASGEINEESTAISSTSINSWEWWRPTVKSFNAFMTVSLTTWGVFTVVDLFDPKKRW
jgi:beta-glucosidase